MVHIGGGLNKPNIVHFIVILTEHKKVYNFLSLWTVCVDHSLTSALCLGSTKGSAVVESVKVTFARQTRWHWPKPMLTVGLFRSLILKRRFGPPPAEHKHHPHCPPTSSGYTFTVSEVDFGTLNRFISGTFDSRHVDGNIEVWVREIWMFNLHIKPRSQSNILLWKLDSESVLFLTSNKLPRERSSYPDIKSR